MDILLRSIVLIVSLCFLKNLKWFKIPPTHDRPVFSSSFYHWTHTLRQLIKDRTFLCVPGITVLEFLWTTRLFSVTNRIHTYIQIGRQRRTF